MTLQDGNTIFEIHSLSVSQVRSYVQEDDERWIFINEQKYRKVTKEQGERFLDFVDRKHKSSLSTINLYEFWENEHE